MLFKLVALAFCFCTLVNAYEWAAASQSQLGVLVGVGTSSKNACIASGASSSGGKLIVENFNGTSWAKTVVTPTKIINILADSAVSTSGLSVVVSILGDVFISIDFGATYAIAEGISGYSAAAYITSNDFIYLVGAWIVEDNGIPQGVSGVATSRDKGVTWTISSNIEDGSVRYGSFPSEDTWYVSSGLWGAAPSNGLSSRHAVVDGKISIDNTEPKAKASRAEAYTGWFGSVSKTTDGGKTWTQVFHTDYENDYLYFNQISCSSVDHCTVVGDGDNPEGGYMTAGYTTFDGGNTWSRVINGDDMSMVGIDYVSETEGWAISTKILGRNILQAQVHHTIDGGKTFSVEKTIDNCFALDLDFENVEGTAIASCSSSDGTNCFAALYR